MLEEKWGVSAAAPVAMAAMPAGGAAAAAEPVEEKTEFDVVIKETGAKKIDVIKVIRQLTNLGLGEAKTMAETPGAKVLTGAGKDAANDAKKRLEEAGLSEEAQEVVNRELKRLDPDVQTVILTGHGTVASGIEGMQLGAADFLQKPVSIEVLCTAVDAAAERSRAGRAMIPRGGRLLGEVEEYFIEQLTPGDTFVFAGEVLCFEGIREDDAVVTRAHATDPMVPSYDGGKFPLSTYLAARVRAQVPLALEAMQPGFEGDAAHNQTLSEQRAAAVVKALVASGPWRCVSHWSFVPIGFRDRCRITSRHPSPFYHVIVERYRDRKTAPLLDRHADGQSDLVHEAGHLAVMVHDEPVDQVRHQQPGQRVWRQARILRR